MKKLKIDYFPESIEMVEADLAMIENELKADPIRILNRKELEDHRCRISLTLSYLYGHTIVMSAILLRRHPFFENRKSRATVTDTTWKFLNPHGERLSFSKHRVESLGDATRKVCPVPSTPPKPGTWCNLKSYNASDVEWINSQPQTVCADDPRFITIPMQLFTFKK